MRFRRIVAALAMAVSLAVPHALAQEQPRGDPPAPQSGESQSLPERVFHGIGGAIRGLLRTIFGPDDREGEIKPPAEQPQPPQQEPQVQQPTTTPAAVRSPEPVTPTPAASAAPASLHSLIARGDYAAAIKMIEQGTDIEAKDPGAGASAIHYAVMKGEIPLVGLLVQRGADVNSRTKSGTTPLHTAVLYRRTEIAEYLIDKGADVNAKSSSGATPLGLALAANFHTLEKMLRTKGAR